ncbi:MAG: DUF1326 domain-containing protein [Acidipila sp.]|nr:DUF1326 domain-containing protein [Acidipila sp.]
MKCRALFLLAAATLLSVAPIQAKQPARTNEPAQQNHLTGDYAEFRTADVYTGPCFANSEVGLTGQQAVLAWHIGTGAWNKVSLNGLSVVAVVQASATLGDPYSNALPARAVMIVDARANSAQQQALVQFAQAQTAGLLEHVVAVEAAPIRFAMGADHGSVTLQAGTTTTLSTRAINSSDDICHNEEVFYQPLAANLNHAMPAMVLDGGYSGNHLGTTWKDAGRRGGFVGHFLL